MGIEERMTAGFREKRSGLFGTAGAGAAKPVTNLASADLFYPEMPFPPSVRQAIAAALEDPSMAHYGHPLGRISLRQTIGKRLEKKYGHSVNPDQHILVFPGSELAMQVGMLPFLEPGDEVLIHDPGYLANSIDPQAVGAVPIAVPLKGESFCLDMAEFEKRLTSRTKMVILTYPNNPTGTIYSAEELRDLCRFVVRHDLILLCDMAFDDYVYDDGKLLWPAAEPGMWERTVSLFTVSKGWGLCGLRVGYMVADTPVLDALLGRIPALMGGAANIAQVGAEAALRDDRLLEENKRRLEIRRNSTYERLCRVPGLAVTLPQAGFQFWIDVSQLGTGTEVIRYLKENAQVLVNNGAAFGPVNGRDRLRLVFGCVNEESIYDKAIDRLCEALKSYPKR
ncbi:MAG: pyridoxal phosphate-dependent aminotransferase [Oscillospiraceae bacterium]|jgi:aspartate/methionine/tyrosine aminotransferase|nr:pyridoxal phosphate-dependent aminotransferase [Oscillospiraceae bacterium]